MIRITTSNSGLLVLTPETEGSSRCRPLSEPCSAKRVRRGGLAKHAPESFSILGGACPVIRHSALFSEDRRYPPSRVGRADWLSATEVPSRAQQQEQAPRSPAPTAKHTEPRSTVGAVGAAGRTRSGTERRARTTSVALMAAAQNGTSGVPADGKHARRRAIRTRGICVSTSLGVVVSLSLSVSSELGRSRDLYKSAST